MRLDGSMVCHQCAGPLIVARDASSAVTCAENCGVSYPTSTWLDLLAQKVRSYELVVSMMFAAILAWC